MANLKENIILVATYELCKMSGKKDDRLLFINTYNMVKELETENPITESGILAIRKLKNSLIKELYELNKSLVQRNMI